MISAALEVPAASSPAIDHADWIELSAIRAADKDFSLQDLVQAIRRTGSTEGLEDTDAATYRGDVGAEKSQEVAENAFAELSRREHACGGAYPYEVGERHLALKPNSEESPYLFLLLLTQFGISANQPNATGIFEDLSARAAAAYLGSESLDASSIAFGFPRRYNKRDFKSAVDHLCEKIGEGVGHASRPRVENQKDGKLDVVAWRDFPDNSAGKVIAFGQCATGRNWRDKIWELQPVDFCRYWMKDTPTVWPTKMFFVPRCVEHDNWDWACVMGGVLFERCRMAFTIGELPQPIHAPMIDYSAEMIARVKSNA